MNSARRLRSRPEVFGKLVLGADLWSTQREILQAVTRHRRVAVKACHASGKSFRPLMVSRMPQNGFEFGGLLSGSNEKDLKS